MRYFFDTEFIEDGKTIDLISIGMVADARWNLQAYRFLSGKCSV